MSRLSPMQFDKEKYKGEIPPGRCTGFSTSLALELIAKCLFKPGEKFQIKDVPRTHQMNKHLSDMMIDYITRLNFDGFEFIKEEKTKSYFVRFNPNGSPGIQFFKA